MHGWALWPLSVRISEESVRVVHSHKQSVSILVPPHPLLFFIFVFILICYFFYFMLFFSVFYFPFLFFSLFLFYLLLFSMMPFCLGEMKSDCVWICAPLMASDPKYLSCAYWPFVFHPSKKMAFHILSPFLNWIFYFVAFEFLNSFYIPYIAHLSNILEKCNLSKQHFLYRESVM